MENNTTPLKTVVTALDFSNEAYQSWVNDICSTIETARLQTSLKVNADLLQLYFTIGKEILEKQETQGWGAQIIDLLSVDLQKRYKGESGYSTRNLSYMKGFAKQYPDFPILQVALAKLENVKKESILQASLAKLDEAKTKVQVPLAQITWYHHISLIGKVKDVSERAFYILKTAENGWSRDVMLLQVENDLYRNQGKAINNFQTTLPEYHSDLARDIFKDPYKFGFLAIEEKVNERMIEEKLIQKITDFLLEMGKGFAFVGHQYHLEVEGDDYYIDILMYHLKLHCYVAIELKAVEFIPEFISKLNFYVSAIDDLVKAPEDNPTIGLLLCTDKKNKKVEYSLRGNLQPLGVASYKTNKSLEERIKSALPTEEEIKAKLDEL
jgi:predicted nuclease of restriction endonuclease-like (RecB) superfamily